MEYEAGKWDVLSLPEATPGSWPLDEDEKKAIGRTFRELRAAIQRSAEDAVVDELYTDLWISYKGSSAPLIAAYRVANDKRDWLLKVQGALVQEIGPDFLVPENLDDGSQA